MRVLHLNAGNETGGGMHHILLLLDNLNRKEFYLGVFEEGELSRRAESLGIKVKVFPQKSRLDFSIIKDIVQFSKEHQIDIIHTHGPRANLFGTVLKRKANCKWISTIHSDPRDDFLGQGIKGKIFTYLNSYSIKRADHLLAISDKFKEILLNHFSIPVNKMTTILNGVDFHIHSSRPYSRQDLGLADGELVIIMVARLEKVKDHITALKALAEALIEDEGFKLLLVGDGREKESLINESNKLGLGEHVQFLGHRDDVIDLYPLADLAVLTSKSESFPLVLLEAAREGLPLLCTNVGGVKKMIPANEYGWIHEVGDFKAIGNSFMEAKRLKDEGKLAFMGDKVKEHCSGHFSIENQANTVYHAYEEILEK